MPNMAITEAQGQAQAPICANGSGHTRRAPPNGAACPKTQYQRHQQRGACRPDGLAAARRYPMLDEPVARFAREPSAAGRQDGATHDYRCSAAGAAAAGNTLKVSGHQSCRRSPKTCWVSVRAEFVERKAHKKPYEFAQGEPGKLFFVISRGQSKGQISRTAKA